MIRRLLVLAGTIVALAAVIAALGLVAFVSGTAVTTVVELGWSRVAVGSALVGLGGVAGFAVAGLTLCRHRTPPRTVVAIRPTGMTMPASWTENVRDLDVARGHLDRERLG